jgi:hypothetical protein
MQLKHWSTRWAGTRWPALALPDTWTLLRGSQHTEPLEAAPASALHAADISALLPQVGLPTVHVRQHPREVCRLTPWGDVAQGRNPYPAHYRSAFACSLVLYPPPGRRALRCAFPARCRAGLTTGLPRSVAVVVWGGSRLFAGGTTSAPADRIAAGLDHVPFWPKRLSSLRLLDMTTFTSASPELTNPHDPGSRLRTAGSRGQDSRPDPPPLRARLRSSGSFGPHSCPRRPSR